MEGICKEENQSIETQIMEMNEVADKGFKTTIVNMYTYIMKNTSIMRREMEDIKEGKGSFRAAMPFGNAVSERKIHQWINTYSHCRRNMT